MTASPQEILNVKEFLEQQHISISLEWVEACISFVKQEHNQNISLQSLRKFVYQQWLVADLEEIGVSSLPPELPTTQKITLAGNFALQVEGIRDISQPAYAQLKDLEPSKNINAEFSAAPEPVLPSWESKPTRMLMLNLTDGCIHIQGMEYRSINTLSPNLPPGIKVLIQGPVDCRFGILFLTPEKINILGGEVENKLTRFSRKAILREILQLPPEEDNETIPADSDILSNNLENEFNPPSVTSRNRDVLQQNEPNSSGMLQSNNASLQNQRRGIVRNTNNTNQNNSSGSDRRIQTTLPFSQQQNIFQSRNQSIQSKENVDNLGDFEDDEFERSLNYDALDELEKETLNKSDDFETVNEEHDIWAEDEDMIHDMLAFQDENPEFQMPFEGPSNKKSESKVDVSKPFTYLQAALQNTSDSTVTIKGFIITVLSKLECTVDKGWNLMVKINDGTASLDVNIHDKVLENIIGISAPAMVKMQLQAAENPDKRKEVMEAISKCKLTLQNYNCLMDIKFTSGFKPCLVKAYPVEELHIQQLCKRVEFNS
ncbi:recQ-mediated genome instability protein 1 [Caerostris darwini]|uniref:RecQ-mediated genome instability protein 1 n=1 Tax=Caerostris darwini TaxID=1538125 RepID=A0AAV4RYA6_9ARAC|nr:recQ-mediated genome instability protein 1 [Caerostris darwini]